MTTHRDAIGLSERLRHVHRVFSRAHTRQITMTVWSSDVETLEEAATALDALQARVKELEGNTPKFKRDGDDYLICEGNHHVDEPCEFERYVPESRATSAEQERDKALACCDSYANENQQLHDRMEKAQQERDEALGRLKPFADAAESLNESHLDRMDLWESPIGLEITAGHLRAARDLVRRLAAGTEKEGE